MLFRKAYSNLTLLKKKKHLPGWLAITEWSLVKQVVELHKLYNELERLFTSGNGRHVHIAPCATSNPLTTFKTPVTAQPQKE